MLELKDVSVRAGKKVIIHDINLKLNENQWMMIVGPNGAGKSTLVNAISQSMPYEGEITCCEKNISKYKVVDYAKLVGILMQNHHVGYSYTVEEIVNLGRYSYSPGLFSKCSPYDTEFVERAMEAAGIGAIRKQSVLTLSGGELQRTFLAQILAQDPQIMILDEPTNHLDLIYQQQVFQMLDKWVKQPGKAIISVVHDLSLAKAYGTHTVLIHDGTVLANGNTENVLTNENLQIAYGMNVSEWMRKMYALWKE